MSGVKAEAPQGHANPANWMLLFHGVDQHHHHHHHSSKDHQHKEDPSHNHHHHSSHHSSHHKDEKAKESHHHSGGHFHHHHHTSTSTSSPSPSKPIPTSPLPVITMNHASSPAPHSFFSNYHRVQKETGGSLMVNTPGHHEKLSRSHSSQSAHKKGIEQHEEQRPSIERARSESPPRTKDKDHHGIIHDLFHLNYGHHHHAHAK
ncbi:hypothetical protein BV898_03282 [Hypsibius exemplaris]|uniref:Uncharacterized protein n=1 Tax=Hypsibius exemplaris TaxID=2072580 RepID=A0A1W0X677_HYPEX|nr:hypothetical protein BV898_03282 [Hypsibius exemplaris]